MKTEKELPAPLHAECNHGHAPTLAIISESAFVNGKTYSREEILRSVNTHEKLLAALKQGENIISGLEAQAENAGLDLEEVRWWWSNVAAKAIAETEGK